MKKPIMLIFCYLLFFVVNPVKAASFPSISKSDTVRWTMVGCDLVKITLGSKEDPPVKPRFKRPTKKFRIGYSMSLCREEVLRDPKYNDDWGLYISKSAFIEKAFIDFYFRSKYEEERYVFSLGQSFSTYTKFGFTAQFQYNFDPFLDGIVPYLKFIVPTNERPRIGAGCDFPIIKNRRNEKYGLNGVFCMQFSIRRMYVVFGLTKRI